MYLLFKFKIERTETQKKKLWRIAQERILGQIKFPKESKKREWSEMGKEDDSRTAGRKEIPFSTTLAAPINARVSTSHIQKIAAIP